MKLEDFDFRVWSKKERKYIKQDNLIGFKFSENRETEFLLFNSEYTRIDTTGSTQYTATNTTSYKSDDLEIELFTGHYDIAGQKVYEGDILGFEDRGEYAICSVFYNKDKAMFIVIFYDEEESVPRTIPMEKFIQATARKRFSVVGNIHKNLGLLESKENKWK